MQPIMFFPPHEKWTTEPFNPSSEYFDPNKIVVCQEVWGTSNEGGNIWAQTGTRLEIIILTMMMRLGTCTCYQMSNPPKYNTPGVIFGRWK